MDRREAIRRASLLLGGTLSASAVTAVMSGCQAAPVDPDWSPQYLTRDQANTVAEIVERIIPTTDTPGAQQAGVHRFIDVFLKDIASEEEQAMFGTGLEDLMKRSKTEYGKAFIKLDPEQMDAILSDLAQSSNEQSGEDTASEMANEGEQVLGADFDPQKFFGGIRQLTILGYFTSEIGATQALKMDAIPGDYQGCIDYSEVGGAWALQ